MKYYFVSFVFGKENNIAHGNIFVKLKDYLIPCVFQRGIAQQLNVESVTIMSFCEVSKEHYDAVFNLELNKVSNGVPPGDIQHNF